jgi:hypothetical protein
VPEPVGRNNRLPSLKSSPGQKMPTPEKAYDCCSPDKCADNKTENHDDAPDCCRGKQSLTAILKGRILTIRLTDWAGGSRSTHLAFLHSQAVKARRIAAWAGFATAALQLAVELPTTRHAANIVSLPSTATALLYKPWDVSAALLLLLARKPVVNSASDRFLVTAPLLQGSSEVRRERADDFLEHCFPSGDCRSRSLRRGSRESTRSVEKASADACVVSFCSKDKPAKEPPVKSKCPKPCCSEDTPAAAPF